MVYTGVTGGDFDVNFDMWLPTTHADYWEQYGDELEDLAPGTTTPSSPSR